MLDYMDTEHESSSTHTHAPHTYICMFSSIIKNFGSWDGPGERSCNRISVGTRQCMAGSVVSRGRASLTVSLSFREPSKGTEREARRRNRGSLVVVRGEVRVDPCTNNGVLFMSASSKKRQL